MDFRSALEVLGLADSPELTRDQVRRTYMRKLREFPPERDPEGFKRLREAYESVRDLPSPDERALIEKLLAGDAVMATPVEDRPAGEADDDNDYSHERPTEAEPFE